eukprot:157489_1
MTEWTWLNVTAIPMLIIVPILPAFGLFVLISIIEFIISNKQLSKSGYSTKAQIVHKYERGSTNYYKKDAGKIYLIVCEFVIKNIKKNEHMLCQSKFMVDIDIYNNYQPGAFLNIVYLPNKYKKYHNLQILNINTINKNTIIKRVIIALFIIFLVPIIIAIFTKSWSIFILLILIGIFYYVVTSILFKCCCPNKSWFKNKSFKQRQANKIDLERFGIEIDQNANQDDENVNTKLLSDNDNLGAKYKSINKA